MATLLETSKSSPSKGTEQISFRPSSFNPLTLELLQKRPHDNEMLFIPDKDCWNAISWAYEAAFVALHGSNWESEMGLKKTIAKIRNYFLTSPELSQDASLAGLDEVRKEYDAAQGEKRNKADGVLRSFAIYFSFDSDRKNYYLPLLTEELRKIAPWIETATDISIASDKTMFVRMKEALS